MAPSQGAVFHAIGRGSCWVTPQPGAMPIHLSAGDLVLFPRGQAHILADQPGRPTMSVRCLVHSRWLVKGRLCGGGDGTRTDFICGQFYVDLHGQHPLWSQLPPCLHLRGDQAQISSLAGLKTTLRQLAAEVKKPRLGSELVVTRLLDVLVVEIVRAWLVNQQPVSASWLSGMRDGKIAAALGFMHKDPERDWTVASLASAVGTSRTVFAEKFTALVGGRIATPECRHDDAHGCRKGRLQLRGRLQQGLQTGSRCQPWCLPSPKAQ
jgi:AraC-like DNA-binding protein